MHGDDNPAADLLDIVWTAVALQPEAEAVIAECQRQIVEQALLLAYRPDSAIRDRVASTFGDLDGPGAALRDLLEDLLTPGSAWPASPD